MKVLYIYRHPDMGFSIGKVFRPIEEEMRKYAEVDSVYLPVPNYSPKGLWQNIRAARKAVKRKRYDIVHITGAEHYLIPFLRGQNTVVTVHDVGFCTILEHKLTYKLKYLLFVTSLKMASFVTFISKKTEEETLRFVKLKKNKTAVISNPVGSEFQYSPKTFNKEHPVVLHIGTKKHKNLDRTIEALKGLKCQLRIVGKVSAEQKEKIRENGIDCIVLENLTDEQILNEYRQADIINFPSLFEGFGMPIIEGQATGRVVITSDLEPMASVAGKNGAIFVNPTDVESIRKAYIQAINGDEKRNRVLRAGVENVKKYQLKNIAYRYFSTYISVCPPRFPKVIALLSILTPWKIRRVILNRYLHYDIHPKTHIGLAFVCPRYLKMEEGASIGHFTTCVHLDRIEMGKNVHIGRSNWITGFPTGTDSRHFSHDYARRSELIIEHDSAITKNHHIDCTNSIHIGHHVTIAGYNSQFLTHSIDVYEGRQDSHPIRIGDYSFVSTSVIILGGSVLPSYSVLAAGATLTKPMKDEWTIYGGIPAHSIKQINKNAKYFSRESGFTY